jgi:hypothetical protein
MKERLLCTLPWPEPTAILDRIREKFPDMDIEYISQKWDPRATGTLPAGTCIP